MQSIFYVRPSAQEIVETAVTLREPDPPVLLGTVTDDSGKPVSHALAVLYASGGVQPDTVAGISCTDAQGTIFPSGRWRQACCMKSAYRQTRVRAACSNSPKNKIFFTSLPW